MKTLACVLLIVTFAAAGAQTHEVILLGQYGGYTPDIHPGDRLVGVEVYSRLGTSWKVFCGGVIQQRFGEDDRSVGAGAYFTPDELTTLYGNLQVGIAPVVIPRLDASLELTRALGRSMTASLLYRYMGFPDDRVHILAPSTSLYALRGWVFTTRVYLSTLAGSHTLTGSFLAQIWYEPSETWSPGLTYAVGNEAYRAGALADITTAASWSTGVCGKFRMSENIRLRLSFEHLNRIGAYQTNTLFASIAYGW